VNEYVSYRIKKEIKEQILSRIKQGVSVTQASADHGVSTKTIYGWLSKQSEKGISNLTYARIRRERDELLHIVGELSLKLKRGEKNKARYHGA